MDSWLVVGNCGGNKWLLNKYIDNEKTHVFKTGYSENAKICDRLTQVSELKDATPEEIKKAGFTLTDGDSLTLTPDSEFGMFIIGKFEEALLKLAVETLQKPETMLKKQSKKKSEEIEENENSLRPSYNIIPPKTPSKKQSKKK